MFRLFLQSYGYVLELATRKVAIRLSQIKSTGAKRDHYEYTTEVHSAARLIVTNDTR